MRKILLYALLICSVAFYASGMNTAILGGAGEGTAAVAYEYTQDFEGSGLPTNWTTEAGTPNYDLSTSGLDMEGSLCLQLDPTESASFTFTPGSADTYMLLKIRQEDGIDNQEVVITFVDGDSAAMYTVSWVGGGGTQAMLCDLIFADPSGATTETIAVDTARYILLRYHQGSGADAEGGIKVSNGSAWGDEVTSTGGTLETAIAKIVITNNANLELMTFDDIRISSSPIDHP